MQFNQPKSKPLRILQDLVRESVRDGETMIGDLTERDADLVVEMLERRGFTTKIEKDTDCRGLLVNSDDWKVVKFWRSTMPK